MKMKKILTAIILCAAVTASHASAAVWPQWADDAKVWAEQHNICDVFLQTPHKAMTRGQTAQLLYEAAGKPAVPGRAPFEDVPEAYDAAVSWAVSQGMVTGVGKGKFMSDRPVTRQEFAAILYREAGSAPVQGTELQVYRDAGEIEDWAYDAM